MNAVVTKQVIKTQLPREYDFSYSAVPLLDSQRTALMSWP